jgi:hypothetical protein
MAEPQIEDRETTTPRRPFAQHSDPPSTELARSIIELARRYAGAKGSSFASTHSLLAAILSVGRSDPDLPTAAAWWWSTLEPHHAAIERAATALYPRGLHDPKELHSYPQAADMTSDLATVLEDAERLAVQHGPKVLGARHLVGALLKPLHQNPTNATALLETAGVDLSACRTAFFHALQSWNQGDAPEAWWRYLLSPDRSQRPLSGYMSDLVAGDDLIGITREVEAMASLVAAWSVEPPLSIGLFGEWGSGKSFFMQKMKERVRQIAREARSSQKGQRTFGYYKNIVQVEFNAWHYVEGNLWASLVEHIFQNLRVLGDTDAEALEEEKQAEARQRKFFDEIGVQELRKQEAEEREAGLKKEQADKSREAQELKRQQLEAEEQATAARRDALARANDKHEATIRDVFGEVYNSPEIKAEVLTLLRPFGIDEEQLKTPRDLRGAIDEAVGSWASIREGWRIVVADRGGWIVLAWVLAVPIGVGLIGWGGSLVFDRASGLIQWVLTPVSTLTGLAASAVAAWKRYKPKLQPLLKTVDDLKTKRTELDRRVDAAQKARDEKVAALEIQAEARRNEAAEKTLEAQQKGIEAGRAAEQAQEAQRKIEALRRQIDDLRPERRIATFIQERAAAEDYRKHLGVPALIRRDFERLSRMFKTQRAAEIAGSDGVDTDGNMLPERNDLAVVNRIVLYVDDLDRCPPHRVVEVLRAIHLLLAFPLFVVVVAVDARWVRRSLLDRFALMLSRRPATTPTDGTSMKHTAKRVPEPPLPGEGATPDDYLEKIFQVAFWLRPLGSKSSVTLVRNLTRPDDVAAAALDMVAGEHDGQEPARPVAGGQRPASSANPPGTPPVVATGAAAPAGQPFEWTPVTPQPPTLQITAAEREYMEQLALLIGRSPRAVKRFLNSYRLIKAMLEPWELATFVGKGTKDADDGTYHPTMLLLAAVTGAPELGQVLCSSLRHQAATDLDVWLTSAGGDARLAAHREWAQLEAMLHTLPDRPSSDTLDALRTAAERVDRFAFAPSRLPEREDVKDPAPSPRRRQRARPRPSKA